MKETGASDNVFDDKTAAMIAASNAARQEGVDPSVIREERQDAMSYVPGIVEPLDAATELGGEDATAQVDEATEEVADIDDPEATRIAMKAAVAAAHSKISTLPEAVETPTVRIPLPEVARGVMEDVRAPRTPAQPASEPKAPAQKYELPEAGKAAVAKSQSIRANRTWRTH